MSPSEWHAIHTPYKGLMPYTEEDAPFFYGREEEREIIVANLMAYKLTLLYGASGVGKSSVLHAGIAHHLRQLTQTNIAERGAPEHIVVVFSAWRDDPLLGLANSLQQTIVQTLGRGAAPLLSTERSFVETLQQYCTRMGGDLIVILDQFEEYFLYHPYDDGPGTFVAEFPTAVNQRDLRASFLIAIRDDSLAKLDRFKGRIPNLFDNYLRIEHLDYEMGRAAIEKPILQYNRLHDTNGGAIAISPELVEAVLDQVKTGRVAMSEAGRGVIAAKSGLKSSMLVETPYLQLVMSRLWEVERLSGSRVLRLETLERLGGAERIVRSHLDSAMAALTPIEAEAAARAFRYLVTPTGTKIAHSLHDLAEFAQLSLAELNLLLHKLSSSDLRILRPVAPPPDRPEAPYYEIFHDVLAPAILNWRSRHAQSQELAREKLRAEKQLHRADEKARIAARLRSLVIALAAVTALAAGAAVLAWIQWKRATAARLTAEIGRNFAEQQARIADSLRIAQLAALDTAEARTLQVEKTRTLAAYSRSRELAAEASASLKRDPELSILLALHAAAATYTIDRTLTSEVHDALNQAVQASRIRSVWSGHTNAVQDLAFDPEGKSLASVSLDGSVIIWNVSSGEKKLTLSGQMTAIYGAAISPDGHRLATAHVDGRAMVHDLSSGQLLLTLNGHTAAVHDVAFSPDGTRLVTAGLDGKAVVWEAASGKALFTISPQSAALNSVAFSPDGRRLATAGGNGIVKLWEVSSRKEERTLTSHAAAVHSVAFSPDGTLLATAGADWKTKLWKVNSGQELLTLTGHTAPVRGVAFSPDGRLLATAGSDGKVKVWDLNSKHEVFDLFDHNAAVNAIAFRPDGRLLATADADNKIKLWDVSPGKDLLILSHAAAVNDVAYSPDRTKLATASADARARVWEVNSGKELFSLTGHAEAVNSITFSKDGKFLATGSDDNTAQVWDAATGVRIARLPHQGDVKSVAFSPESGLLATASFDQSARVWEIATGRQVFMATHAHWVQDVAFSPDGKRLATASSDKTARLWEIASGKEVLTLTRQNDAVTGVDFSPDGRHIATACADGMVKIWDAASGRELFTVLGHSAAVNDVKFSPDGTRLATASADGSMKLWTAASGRLLLTLHNHGAVVNRLAFSPDGKHLATASGDKTVRIHALIADDLIALARKRVTRALTAEECRRFLHVEKCPPTPF
ncbi:MAG: NACHT and WD repeat domain-containing protein [bacterium]